MRGASRGRRRQGREEPERENRGGRKYGPRGPRKPLKRLDSDKEIKVNSKENPRVCQTIPRNFQGFSREIEGFPRHPPHPRFDLVESLAVARRLDPAGPARRRWIGIEGNPSNALD